MSILVTGGCGFIGSHFILDYLAQGPIVNLDKLSYAANPEVLQSVQAHPDYHFVQADVRDEKTLADIFAQHSISAIVHFAAHTHVDRSIEEAMPFVENNVQGTVALLKQAQRYYESLSSTEQEKFKFLYVSTDEVYGSLAPEAAAFTENDSVQARNPYSASKAAAEQFVMAWHNTYKLPIMISRCGNNYGAHQYPEKLIPKLFKQGLHQEPMTIYGDGQQVRDWIYVKDHCAALWFLLQHGAVGEVYNIGAQQEVTNKQIARQICDFLDRKQSLTQGLSQGLIASSVCGLAMGLVHSSYHDLLQSVADRPGHDRRYALDVNKLNALGWQAKYSFEQGMQETLEAYWQQYCGKTVTKLSKKS